MKDNKCGQVSIPQIDNSQEECNEIFSTDCVAVHRVSLKLHNVPGESLTKYLELIDNKISVLENKIVTLTKELNFHINPPAEGPITTPEIE